MVPVRHVRRPDLIMSRGHRCWWPWFASKVIVSFGLLILSVITPGIASEVPAFLEKGRVYTMDTGSPPTSRVRVLEIDKKSSWIKVEGEYGGRYWLNLNRVIVVGEPELMKQR